MYPTKITFYFKQTNRKINGEMRRVWIKREYPVAVRGKKYRAKYSIKMVHKK